MEMTFKEWLETGRRTNQKKFFLNHLSNRDPAAKERVLNESSKQQGLREQSREVHGRGGAENHVFSFFAIKGSTRAGEMAGESRVDSQNRENEGERMRKEDYKSHQHRTSESSFREDGSV